MPESRNLTLPIRIPEAKTLTDSTKRIRQLFLLIEIDCDKEISWETTSSDPTADVDCDWDTEIDLDTKLDKDTDWLNETDFEAFSDSL